MTSMSEFHATLSRSCRAPALSDDVIVVCLISLIGLCLSAVIMTANIAVFQPIVW